MPFTFPTDSNNKAGAVKTKNAGNGFVVPIQEEPYDALEVRRATLVASTDTLLTFTAQMDTFDVYNFGAGDIYVKIDVANTAVDNADALLIGASTGYAIRAKGTVLHVISAGTPKIQVIGYKNN